VPVAFRAGGPVIMTAGGGMTAWRAGPDWDAPGIPGCLIRPAPAAGFL
jgi:hypothetical protein